MPAELHETVIEATGVKARLARVYAEALLALAGRENAADAIGEELASTSAALLSEPRIGKYLDSPVVKATDKQHVLGAAFESRTSILFRKFLGVLNKNGRLGMIPAISTAYRAIRDVEAGRVRVLVRSAVALSDERQAGLVSLLGSKLNKQPILNVRVEPELLGGLIVQVGDRVYDTSVRTRLNTLRNHLMASRSHV